MLDSDVGVWCSVCKATKHYVGSKGYKGKWIQCSLCNAWQHLDCYKKPRGEHFLCKFCFVEQCSLQGGTRHRNSEKQTLHGTIEMISKTAKYRRTFSKLCSTPDRVAQFLRQLLDKYGLTAQHHVIDLGAGHGALTKYLHPNTLAVEKDPSRFENGRTKVPFAKWMAEDIFSRAFVDYVIKAQRTFDFVVSNPDFEVAFQTIVIGLFLLKTNSKFMVLLPSDYFEASSARMRVYKILNFRIEKEYKLGHLGYYEDKRNAEKKSTDSIFVPTHGRENKYEYSVVNARLAGMLTC